MAGVAFLIATLTGLGVIFILPQWPGLWWLHWPLTCWLSCVVSFFYHAAVTADPGEFTMTRSVARDENHIEVVHVHPMLHLQLVGFVTRQRAVAGILRRQLHEYQPIQQGAMEGYTFCPVCESAKAPTAHHCRCAWKPIGTSLKGLCATAWWVHRLILTLAAPEAAP